MRGNFLCESDGNLILRVGLLLKGWMGMEEMGRMGKKKRSVWHYWAQKMAKRTLPGRLVNLLKKWQEVRGRWTKWPRRPWGSPWTPGRACRTLASWSPLVQLPQLPSSLPGNWGSVRSTDFHHTKGCCLMTWRAFSPGSTDLHYFHNSLLACFQLCQLSAAIWPIDWFSGTWQTGWSSSRSTHRITSARVYILYTPMHSAQPTSNKALTWVFPTASDYTTCCDLVFLIDCSINLDVVWSIQIIITCFLSSSKPSLQCIFSEI